MQSIRHFVFPFALFAYFVQGAHALINYTDGFNCNLISTGVLTVSDGGRAFPRLTSIGGGNTLCYLEMTTDTAVARASSAFTDVVFEDNSYNFVAKFTYRIYGTGAGAGDGLAFVLHQDSRGRSALGGQGGFLGVYGPNVIQPALVVELDTFLNSELGDKNPIEVHVRTTRGTVFTDVANVAANNIRTSASLNERRSVEIRYQNNRLEVFLNDVQLVDTTSVSLPTLFNGGNRAIVGFTAATGVEADLHDVFNWTMTNVRNPGTITCIIPIPILGPILCWLIGLFPFLSA